MILYGIGLYIAGAFLCSCYLWILEKQREQVKITRADVMMVVCWPLILNALVLIIPIFLTHYLLFRSWNIEDAEYKVIYKGKTKEEKYKNQLDSILK